MKFTEHLSAHLTPEWRKQYIEYEALKEILYKALEDFEELPVIDAITVHSHFNERDEIFFASCEIELEKINNFYAEKLAEARRKFCELKDTLDAYLAAQNRGVFRTGKSTQDNSRLHSRSSTPGFIGSKASLAHLGQSRGNIDSTIHRRPTLFSKNLGKQSVDNQIGEKSSKPILKPHDLKLAFSEFYLSLILLQNYQSLNFTGFRKILKKHDKLFQRSNGLEWHRMVIAHEPFYVDNSADELIAEVETIYTNALEYGNRQKAMKRLRVPPLADTYSHWSVFRFGLFAGIFIVQITVIIITKISLDVPSFSWPAFRLFRSVFLLDFFICLLAVNVYGWRSSGVNHVLIFEIDPRSHLDHFQLLELGFFLSDIWGAAVIFFLFSDRMNVPHLIAPLALVLFMIVFLIQPFGFFHRDARKWLILKFWRVIRAPFVQVKFPDFFIGDQLNSLSFLFPDVGFFFCFYTSCVDWSTMTAKCALRNSTSTAVGQSPLFAPKTTCDGIFFGLSPILKSLPAWFRFAQCLRRYNDLTVKSPVPHLLNAGKYATTLFVTFFTYWWLINNSTYVFAMLVVASIVNSVCTYSWDVIMDWGLLDRSSKENRGLREQLVYRFRAYYYVAFLENLVIRLSWTFNLTFERVDVIQLEIVKTIVLFAEVIRRIIWNFFRLENEHLNNCGNFRAVRDIFIAPIQKPKPVAIVQIRREGNTGQLERSLSPNRTEAGDESSPPGTAEQESSQDQHPSRRHAQYDSSINAEALLNEYSSLNVAKSKSLWRFLQSLNTRGKNERRRQQGLEVVSNMERALRQANCEVPRYGINKAENCLRKLSEPHYKRSRFENLDLPETEEPLCQDRIQSSTHSLPARKRAVNEQILMVSDVDRPALEAVGTPSSACPGEENKTGGNIKDKYVALLVNSNKNPEIVLPGNKLCIEVSPENDDLVFLKPKSLESSVERLSDESPNATALPRRTMYLAKQLRSFLRTCAEPREQDTSKSPSSLSDFKPTDCVEKSFVRNPRCERYSCHCVGVVDNPSTPKRQLSVPFDHRCRQRLHSKSRANVEIDPSTSSSSLPSSGDTCILNDTRRRILHSKEDANIDFAPSSRQSRFTVVPAKLASFTNDDPSSLPT